MKRVWVAAVALAAMLVVTGSKAFALEETVSDFDTFASTFSFNGGGDTWADNNFDPSTRLGPSGSSFHLQWGNVNATDEFSGGGVRFGNSDSSTVDISTYNCISFLIYTSSANFKADVRLKDYIDADTQHEAKVKLSDYVNTIPNTWQQVIIPLAAFQRSNSALDLTKANNILIIADFSNGLEYSPNGSIFIDNLKLSKQHHSPAHTVVYSGSDAGVASLADMPGDTLLCWDQSVSSVTSNQTQVLVSTGFAISLVGTLPSNASALAGTTYYFSYAVRNDGNKGDRVVFTAANTAGQSWPVTVFWDKDKSGGFTAGDAAWPDSMGLLPDSTHYLLLGVYIPASATDGLTSTVALTAKDNNGSGANDNWPTASNDDTLNPAAVVLTCSIPSISVVKSTDVAYALPGSTVTYTMTVKNDGSSGATNLYLTDVVPFNMGMINNTSGTGTPDIYYYVSNVWTTIWSATATKVRWHWASVAASSSVTATYKAYVK